MANAVWFISYKLIKGVSTDEFLIALEDVKNEILSKQKGFISWQVLLHDDIWVDLVTWETIEDAKNGESAGGANPKAQKFYSFIDFESLKQQNYSMERSY